MNSGSGCKNKILVALNYTEKYETGESLNRDRVSYTQLAVKGQLSHIK